MTHRKHSNPAAETKAAAGTFLLICSRFSASVVKLQVGALFLLLLLQWKFWWVSNSEYFSWFNISGRLRKFSLFNIYLVALCNISWVARIKRQQRIFWFNSRNIYYVSLFLRVVRHHRSSSFSFSRRNYRKGFSFCNFKAVSKRLLHWFTIKKKEEVTQNYSAQGSI